MTKVSVDEAQERLPELLDEVDRGEEVVITKGDGATAYTIVVALETAERTKHVTGSGDGGESLPPLAEMIGKGAGLYRSPEEVDQHIRNLRDEWDS